MKKCSILIRVLAIFALVILLFVTIASSAFSFEDIADSREKLEERIDEHEDDHKAGRYSYRNCETCEEYEKDEEDLDRRVASVIISGVGSFALYFVFCCILYSLGLIIAKTGNANGAEKPMIPTCPNCGKIQRKGSRFCDACGAAVES